MRCNHCYEEFPDSAKFCPKCGKPVVRVNEGEQGSMDPVNGGVYNGGWQQNPMEPQYGYRSYNQQEDIKPPKPMLPKALIAAVLAVALLIGVFAVIGGGSTGSTVDINSISAYLGEWNWALNDSSSSISIYEEQGGITVVYHYSLTNSDIDFHFDSYEIYPAGEQSYLKLKSKYLESVFMLLSPNILVELTENQILSLADENYTTVIDGTEYKASVYATEMYMRVGVESEKWPLRTPPGNRVYDYKYYPEEHLLVAEFGSEGYSEVYYIENSGTYYWLGGAVPEQAIAPRGNTTFSDCLQIDGKCFVVFGRDDVNDLY